MIKVLVAVNVRDLEKYIGTIDEVIIVATIRKWEKVIEQTISLNPQCLILSDALNASKTKIRSIISEIRQKLPDCKIVYLFGEPDEETKYQVDYFIRSGVYNFIIGEINDSNLKDAIFKNYTLADVERYLLPVENNPAAVQPEVITVEKVIEKTVVEKSYIGNYEICVASLFPRAGCTHLALELASYYNKRNISAGVILNHDTYYQIKSHYGIDSDTSLSVSGVEIYTETIRFLAEKRHKVLINDLGVIETAAQLRGNKTILINPCSEWEYSKILDFVINNDEILSSIEWVYYPCSDKDFQNIRADFQKIGCRTYQLMYNPEWDARQNVNSAIYDAIFNDEIKVLNKSKKTRFWSR